MYTCTGVGFSTHKASSTCMTQLLHSSSVTVIKMKIWKSNLNYVIIVFNMVSCHQPEDVRRTLTDKKGDTSAVSTETDKIYKNISILCSLSL